MISGKKDITDEEFEEILLPFFIYKESAFKNA